VRDILSAAVPVHAARSGNRTEEPMLKSLTGPFAVAALLAAGVVAAQTTTSPSERQTYPNSSSQSTTTTQTPSTSSSKSHKHAMKDCMAQEEQNHPSISKNDIKKACKSQVESSSNSSSPHE
jgi:hypothetical protein